MLINLFKVKIKFLIKNTILFFNIFFKVYKINSQSNLHKIHLPIEKTEKTSKN
jgi:hypothetical protein